MTSSRHHRYLKHNILCKMMSAFARHCVVLVVSMVLLVLIPTEGFQSSVGRRPCFRENNVVQRKASVVSGPPIETKPDYENIHGPLGKGIDNVFMKMFRSRLADQVGIDSELPQDDYMGLMELTKAMNARFSDRTEVHRRAQATLVAMFPEWMPGSYAVLFSKPLPEFSCRMNAWATWVAGQWLMGECEINDVEVDGGVVGKDQGLLVKRCRFLEESGCASVCVNSCKIPTQNFFMENMGLPLTMTPDYETFECQFAFGLTPTAQSEFDAKSTPCLSRCPSLGGMRKWHDSNNSVGDQQTSKTVEDRCEMMGE